MLALFKGILLLLVLLLVAFVIMLPLVLSLSTRWSKWRDMLEHARGRFKRMLTVGLLVVRRRHRRSFLLAASGAILVALLIIVLGWLSWQWRALMAPALWLLPLLILLWAEALCLGESYVHYRLWRLSDLWLFEREHTEQVQPPRRHVRGSGRRRRSADPEQPLEPSQPHP
ncbi:hypothetical protein [Thermogemmatispora carboxidivorans]|uniref:hypothetical protein n=1 Tax=Thermogemmatispora carboxidivorans TaxID=1382306 RepID=UPI00069A87AD|nr:hypothetical protein [Thermogemmatispora carboxidivorans]